MFVKHTTTNATGQKKQDWRDYRDAIRDIPTTYEDPDDVVWPTKPE